MSSTIDNRQSAIANRERHLAPYACRSADAHRVHPEPDDSLRGPFLRDQHRIIESTAFRRLEHKTQVFAPAHHDHFRTRLTHTLEVAHIARCLAVALQANEQLAEAIALAHDLGHPPFGHAGEVALDEAMADHGGFNHNTHALRMVDYLEHPFPAFRGLNLTAATRAGLTSHATRYDRPQSPSPVDSLPGGTGLPTVEAQVVSVADRIAYNCHDLEDAIGAEFVDLDLLMSVDLWRQAYTRIIGQHGGRHIFAVRRAVLDAILDFVLQDVIQTSLPRLAVVHSLEEVRQATSPLVVFSPEVDARLNALESFLLENVYRHPQVAAMDDRGKVMVLELFAAYRAQPDALPPRFAERIAEQGIDRVICDFIAGMTDRYCNGEYNRLRGQPLSPGEERPGEG